MKLLSVFVALLLMVSSAQAAVSVFVDPGTPLQVFDIVQFSVTNSDMHGLKVTAHYADATTETQLWDGPSGQASGARFLLTETGDTFFSPWTLENLDTNHLLTKLVIEAGTNGNTVFDLQKDFSTVAGPFVIGDAEATGSDGSQKGLAFNSANSLNVTATYSNIVNLPGDPPVGDIWAMLTIEFADGLLGGPDFFGNSYPYVFHADTDTWGVREVNIPEAPEPGSLALMAGLGAIGAWQYRRSQKRKLQS